MPVFVSCACIDTCCRHYSVAAPSRHRVVGDSRGRRSSSDPDPPPISILRPRGCGLRRSPYGSYGQVEIRDSTHETSAHTGARAPAVRLLAPCDRSRRGSPIHAALRSPSGSTLAGLLRVGRSHRAGGRSAREGVRRGARALRRYSFRPGRVLPYWTLLSGTPPAIGRPPPGLRGRTFTSNPATMPVAPALRDCGALPPRAALRGAFL